MDMGLKIKENPKVVVGLSGGVDSAVAALLLKDKGYDVTGVYLQCWDFSIPGCGGDIDRADAAAVASILDINFKHLDFIEDYQNKVLSYFYESYASGGTPNPDILCNSVIKFGLFLDWALDQGYDYIATGHYARTVRTEECVKLFCGADKSKDQSYFLYRLNQRQLSRALFPLGGLTKNEVRELARVNNLPVFDKPDSTGICFIGDVSIQDFLEERIEPKEGNVILKDGRAIGTHEGVWFYTIGQRRGFNITEYMGIPLYVIDKKVEENELVVGPISEAQRSVFEIEQPHWICESPKLPFECVVRIRNLGKFRPVTVTELSSGLLKIESSQKFFGVAPGQSAVFYSGEQVLGGGIIR